MRTAYDVSPLYRSMIGVDRMADLVDSAMRSEGDRGYPPCDPDAIPSVRHLTEDQAGHRAA